jgi:N-acetylneuraminic acid mutarotase
MVNLRVLGIVLSSIVAFAASAFGQNTWSSDTSLGFTPRFTAAACGLDGKIVVLGGNADLTTNRYTDTVEMFDPVQHSWREGIPLPAPRAEHAACVVDGKIYVIGGNASTMATATPLDSMIVFDAAANRWDTAPPMPTGRAGLTACAVNGKIYAIAATKPTAHWGRSKYMM